MADLPDALPGVLSRRGLMAAGAVGLAALGVSACSTGTPSRKAGTPASPGPLTPDVTVATQALAAVRAASAAVRATSARYPAVRSDLAALTTLHLAHERALVDAVPKRASTAGSPTAYVVPRRREVALTRLTAAEQHLHDTLGALALRAQSGEFARLLASMGTAVTLALTELAA